MRMRMLLVAGLLAVPGLALAEGGDYGQEKDQGAMGQTGELEPGAEQRAGMEMGSQSGQMTQQQQQQLFQARDNFEVKGTVASVNPQNNQITVQRENLPPAQLSVANQTKIRMDGQQASLNQLQPGNEVRAKFNLAGDNAVATEIEAKPSKGQKEMQKGQREMQKGQQEMERR